jgi:hypothetical protein
LHTSLRADRFALLDECDVAPRARAESLAVVHRHPGEHQAVLGNGVPRLARHLAGLAADAHAGVGEKPHPWWVVRITALGGRIGVAEQRTI